ncbi:N-6 DNA methylase [Streptomyces sp. SAI-041]|uniref:N-6 DNA methylase n=1 Tax=Streptomyces sp. SAI-041 TaxID=2940548 RepID=UPI002473B388|nr:N-6 DNA methylase [Streptomyces sp. SAI-041]MDH6547168.1 type I restriction-modification system DNA methylase subunit [Streptomyces sp. SAI-041]
MSAHEAVPVSLAEIARIAGVGRAAVSNWRRRHDSFPTRIGGTDVSPQFSLAEVEQWLRDNGKFRDVGGRELLWPRFEALGSRNESGLAIAAAAHRMRSRKARTTPPELSARARDLVAEAARVGRKEGPREVFEFLLARWLETHVRQLSTTPPQLAALMARIALAVRLGPAQDGLTLLDPACGSGHLGAAAVQEYDRPGLEVLACERDPALAALAAARLEFLAEGHDIRTHIVSADTLRDDPFAGSKADIALCNPPFNERDWGYAELATDQRWTHGLPPRTEPELAWVQHLLSHLKPGGAAVIVLPPAVASRKAGRRIRGSLLRTGALRAVVSLPPGSAQPHSVSLQLWILRAAPDGSATAPPSQDALLVDATRFARPGTREPSPDWDSLGSDVLTAMAALDHPDQDPPQGAVRVPLLDLLDDEVDVTPGRYTAAAAEPSRKDLAVKWDEFGSLLTDLADHATRLSTVAFEAGTPQTTTTVGDLVKAGALTLRAGQQPPESAAPAGGAAVPLLTITDLLHDGTPSGTVPAGSAPAVAEEGDVVVAGVARAFKAWVHQGPPTALGPQLYLLRVDAEKLEPHFLAGCLCAPANGRQAGTHASSSSRVDIRRLQVLQLPLEKQTVYAETFHRLRTFEELLTAAGGSGKELVSDLSDRLAAGGLPA